MNANKSRRTLVLKNAVDPFDEKLIFIEDPLSRSKINAVLVRSTKRAATVVANPFSSSFAATEPNISNKETIECSPPAKMVCVP